jgi:hypothetical protein
MHVFHYALKVPQNRSERVFRSKNKTEGVKFLSPRISFFFNYYEKLEEVNIAFY